MANPSQHQAFLYVKQTTPFNTIGFRWPTNREVPSSVRKLTVQEFVAAVELASYAVESMKEKSTSAEFEEILKSKLAAFQSKADSEKASIEEVYRSEKQSLEDIWTRKYTTLDSANTALTHELNALKIANAALLSQIEEIKKSTSEVFSAAIEKASAAKESSHLREIERLERSNREAREAMERTSKDICKQLETRYKDETDKLQQQLEALQKKTSDSSVLIGKYGEQAFEDLVTQHTSWKLENTSKSAHATDRSCTLRECNILFEVKNYSGDVPSEELKKFYRDMEEHNDYHMGVFISMKTPIQTRKQKGYLHIEWTKNSQMLLIFQNFHEHDPRDMLSFIDASADTALTMYRAHAESLSSSSLNYQKRIDQAKLYIEKQLKSTNDLLKQMRVDKVNLSDMIDRNYTAYKYSLEQSRVSLQSCISILMNTIEEELIEQKVDEQPPEQLPQETLQSESAQETPVTITVSEEKPKKAKRQSKKTTT